MKSIEEVIDNIVDEHKECRWMDAGELREYLEVVAQEQKAIDDAELARLKEAWEKEAEVNHDTKMAYAQGYHDAVEKACEWLKKNYWNYIMLPILILGSLMICQLTLKR